MISVIKSLLILLLLLVSASALLAQESFQQQFNYASKLYEEEKYFDSVTEFKRLLFFDTSETFSFEANKYLGYCYRNGGKFSDAIHHFTLAELSARNDEELFESRIEVIKINILRRTTERAILLLDSLESDFRFRNKTDEIIYWRGWTYIFADDWENASSSFAELSTGHELKYFCDSVNTQFYNVTVAKVLSVFIPGAGQFYTGEYVSGLISLGWNLLWGYLTINAFAGDRIFDGLMIGSLLWWRFYTGNLQNAEKFALEKNLIMSNDALRYLQSSFPGPKP